MLLAFDTATPRVTVALHDGSTVVAAWHSEEGLRHGEMLAPGIEAVLAEAGAGRRDVTAVAVGAGPGPFTGLRVGLVTARTFGFALEVPVYAVCTLDVLAAEAVDAGLDDFVVATDARRKEVYLARYSAGRRLADPVVARPADVATDEPVAGRGALLYPEAFPHAVQPELPRAAVLADVVTRERYELLDPDPLYLRRPDTMAPRPPKKVS
ncbi:MAG TPA: tRNA (adenosine(37)-N6)-threonylcarbamoyltransferase complex dimerization subunit type 1 TsaB [Marmoricola sp.]|nr:tRNA (adenosine(37)-N6)-threonylcarbamoyltransferase complex dimerization subunit type 1 TsaB [Marmoricola sp.]